MYIIASGLDSVKSGAYIFNKKDRRLNKKRQSKLGKNFSLYLYYNSRLGFCQSGSFYAAETVENTGFPAKKNFRSCEQLRKEYTKKLTQ